MEAGAAEEWMHVRHERVIVPDPFVFLLLLVPVPISLSSFATEHKSECDRLFFMSALPLALIYFYWNILPSRSVRSFL